MTRQIKSSHTSGDRKMRNWREEPSLREVLNDPIVLMVMQRDGVEAFQVLDLVQRMQQLRRQAAARIKAATLQ